MEEEKHGTVDISNWLTDVPYDNLLDTFSSWEAKVVHVLNMIRCRGITEYNHKWHICEPTRFCHQNIALFDLDKESEVVRGPLFRELPSDEFYRGDSSVNIISIKLAKTDVHYPIKIYGTVIERDQNDYRCVYLFKRGRDNPQLITKQNCWLALTGPYRSLSGNCFMYFEFDLKFKGKGAVDRDFSKGLLTRNVCGDTTRRLSTLSLESCLSILDLVYVPFEYAVEASVGVNFLNGISKFHGKIFAWTSGNDSNKINLYDSEASGTETKLGSGGSVPLSRHILCVPLDEELVLYIFARGSNNRYDRCIKLVLGTDVEEHTCRMGTYELQVKIVWTAMHHQTGTAWYVEEVWGHHSALLTA